MPKWSEARLLRVARQIDEATSKVEDLVRSVRESDYIHAAPLADELSECVVLSNARDIVESFLDDGRSEAASTEG